MNYLFYLVVFFYVYQLLKTFKTSNFRKRVNKYVYEQERPRNLEVFILVLASEVIKANAKHNSQQIRFVRNHFIMNYGEQVAEKAFRHFKMIRKQSNLVLTTCTKLRTSVPYRFRLRILEFLFEVAKSDRYVTSDEELRIRQLAASLALRQHDYLMLRSLYYKEQYQHEYYRKVRTSSPLKKSPYTILGVSKTATKAQIKKAYRSLVKKYHPDRLGNPSALELEKATQRFQEIQDAYEQIK